jgi:transcriptional regulator with XRE-family HTH domain
MSITAADASSKVAGDLIRRVRRESGLSQAELARRAGMPRSVLSAYEHAHRQPAVAALARIAAAGGLKLDVVPATSRLDLVRAGGILAQVLDLAEQLPQRRRGKLAYPPLSRFAA